MLLFCILVIGACAPVGPDYHSPEYRAGEKWHSEEAEGLSGRSIDPAELARWWDGFNDPVLAELINRAVAGNLDLQQAAARLHEARARLGVSRADKFPDLNASGSASRRRSGGWSRDLFAAGFDAGWELDIFGGVRRSVEAAGNDLEAGREDLRDVLVSLLAEVAVNYIEARTFQARLVTVADNIASQENSSQLTTWRNQAGLSDELAVQQARYNLASTRAQLPVLRTGLKASLNRLAVLTGREPGQINELLEGAAPIPTVPVSVAVGVPAEALRQRPDLRRAERQLAAATARIGVAAADLYPRFRLSGSIGVETVDSADILADSSRTSGFGPSFSWALFDGGRIRRNIEVRSAQQEQELLQYRSTLLAALEEVENALTAYVEEQRRQKNLIAAAQAARAAADLAMDKYQTGLQDFNTVLDAQRSQLSFEDQLTQSRGAVGIDLIRLYKAMGGGWQTLAADPDRIPLADKEQ
ncbi:MAG TPA: efflux transporter outer membrane subunit [Geothermobacteraceae bacterium]|nr:efflux transporter outer membrane subunit [Geothermobacteraceae bacterium]